jgi:carbon-monoxide dehydrogenase small subunit
MLVPEAAAAPPGPRKEAAVRNVSLTVNEVPYELELDPRELLVHVLRERLGLTGTVVGCDTSSCGACTVLLDGESV